MDFIGPLSCGFEIASLANRAAKRRHVAAERLDREVEIGGDGPYASDERLQKFWAWGVELDTWALDQIHSGAVLTRHGLGASLDSDGPDRTHEFRDWADKHRDKESGRAEFLRQSGHPFKRPPEGVGIKLRRSSQSHRSIRGQETRVD